MTDVHIDRASPSSLKLRIFSRLRRALTGRHRTHPALDLQAMSDYLRRDIGLAPADISVEQDIKMLNVNIRSGIIFPRPC